MDRSDVICLIKETYHMDDHNQPIPEESRREVYCNAKSVTRTELFEAGQNGHRAAWLFEMFFYDYENEKQIGYDPTPIYPDFSKNPQYTKNGVPFTSVYQDVCKDYQPISQEIDFVGCGNCKLYESREELIGICRSENRRWK